MAIPTPLCSDSQWDLLRKILLGLPDIVPAPPVASTLQSGSQAIASGADVACVIFPTPFVGIPNVVATLSRDAADPVMELNIDEDSITATGFCVTLGGTTINANYVIQWMAN